MWLDDELMALDEYDRNELCRNIGMAGEQYAFELVCQELLKQGYEVREKKDGLLTLAGEKGEYMVFRPDTGRYHQAGWDIRVTGRLLSEPEERNWYLEVKTHTPGSVRKGMLRISNQQMKLAAGCGDDYILISVIYNYKLEQVERATVYRNLFRQLAEGNLQNTSDGYMFMEKD